MYLSKNVQLIQPVLYLKVHSGLFDESSIKIECKRSLTIEIFFFVIFSLQQGVKQHGTSSALEFDWPGRRGKWGPSFKDKPANASSCLSKHSESLMGNWTTVLWEKASQSVFHTKARGVSIKIFPCTLEYFHPDPWAVGRGKKLKTEPLILCTFLKRRVLPQFILSKVSQQGAQIGNNLNCWRTNFGFTTCGKYG